MYLSLREASTATDLGPVRRRPLSLAALAGPLRAFRRSFMRSTMLLTVLAAFIVLAAGAPQQAAPRAEGLLPAAVASVDLSGPDAAIVVEVSSEAWSEVMSLADSGGAGITFASEPTGILVLASGSGALVERLKSVPGVSSISSERKAWALYTPDDKYLSYQWGLDTVNAYEAWDIARGTHDVVVGVLDTGIGWNHADLGAKMWRDA